MIVIVQDANILIDLERCALLGVFLGLDEYEHHTTDFVLSELPPVLSETLRCNQVEIRGSTPREVAELLAFKERQPAGLSLADCSVFRYALHQRAVLLTGDSKLRSCAEDAGVQVHGILWVLDQIMSAAWLSVSPWLQLWRC